MPSIVALDRNRAGAREWVRGRLLDGSIRFTNVPPQFFSVWLVPPAQSLLSQLYYRVAEYRFLDEDELEFRTPEVGAMSGGVPPDVYEVVFRAGFWEGRGDIPIRVSNRPTPPAVLAFYPWIAQARRLTARILATIRLILFPLRLLVSPSARAAFRAFRAGSGARLAFFALPGPGKEPEVSVEPLIDGQEIFGAMERIIRDAERFIFLAFWSCDEQTLISALGQRDPATGQPPAGAVTLENLLKDRIHALASAPLDVKVLLWNPRWPTHDWSVFEPGGDSDVGDLPLLRRPWGSLQIGSFDEFELDIRTTTPFGRGSAAARSLLLEFYDEFTQEANAGDVLPFPTGIQVGIESHPDFTLLFGSLGCHHQKFVLTEKALLIGGANLTQGDWDTAGHLGADPRRADSSGSSGSGGAVPRHDLAAIVRGPLLDRAALCFAMRWNHALTERGAFAPIVAALSSDYGELKDFLEDDAVLSTLRLPTDESDWTARIASTPDPQHAVDEADIAATLPQGTAWALGPGGDTDIKLRYERAIQSLSTPESFLYIENQYFTALDIAKWIFERWKENVSVVGPNGRPRAWPEHPFAYIVITYEPEWIDTLSISGPFVSVAAIAFFEMQLLKWLEVRTARTIFEKTPQGELRPACAVEFPQTDIEFTDGEQDDPTAMDDDSEFLVHRAIVVNPATGAWQYSPGNTKPDRHPQALPFEVGDVMTDSDIMTYALATNTRYAAMPITATGPDPAARLRGYMSDNEIYNHSKSPSSSPPRMEYTAPRSARPISTTGAWRMPDSRTRS